MRGSSGATCKRGFFTNSRVSAGAVRGVVLRARRKSDCTQVVRDVGARKRTRWEAWLIRGSLWQLREQRHGADVSGWKRQARDVVVCAGALKDSSETAYFAGVVLVQVGLCTTMINEVL